MANNNFEQYDDNNLEHTKNGPDYGQAHGALAWRLENSLEYIEHINKATIEGIEYVSKLRMFINRRT